MTKEMEDIIKQAASVLKAMGASEIYIFGSLAESRDQPDSDIDIAVSGIPPRQFFRAMGELGDLLRRPFDLVDLDEESPFTSYLRKEGGLIRVG